VFFTDNPDTDGLNNWTNNGWVTTSDAFSGSTALTNASGSYGNNDLETLTLANAIDISTAEQAVIQYFAKWDIERDFDFTQVEGSIDDGATWIPLTGTYTKPGSTPDTNPYSEKSSADEAHQPDGEPLYDGDMQDKWSLEEIVIDAANNSTFQGASSLLVRFVFDSDSSNITSGYTTSFAGFTFDDFSIISTILVPPAPQTITFPAIADQLTTAIPVTLNATASSGLAVSYTVTSGPATVSGSLLTLDGTSGTVTVEATQEGATFFESATPVSVTFMVNEPACALETPQNISASAFTEVGATIQWDATNGDGYEVRFRESGDSNFYSPFNTANTQLTFLALESEMSYDVKVNSTCSDGSVSPDSTIISFTTLAPPITYCSVSTGNGSVGFISRFELNTINNSSGGQSYSDFTAISTDLETYRTYTFTIEPTWTGNNFLLGYAIWIDYNQDGYFDTTTEQVFTQTPTNATSITGSFAVPYDALFGPTRLRVATRYNDIPVSCGGYGYGEIEDYTVVIVEGFPDTEAPTVPTNLTASDITETTAILSWDASTDAIGVTEYTVYQDGISIATVVGTSHNVVGLAPETIYDFAVTASDLAGNESNQSNTVQIQTQVQAGACVNGIESFPYTLGFEDGIDTWTQNTDDDIDWTIRASSTPSGGTGPHTSVEGSYFIYTEASGNGIGYPNKQAILTSPCIDLTGSLEAYISFQHHMYGTSNNVGSLDLEVSIDNGITWTSIWGEEGDLGGQWNAEIISLDAYAGLPISLRFNRVTGSDYRGDVALDDISIGQGAIPTAPVCDTTEDEYPYRVSFEITFNDWTQSDADDLDWTRYSRNTPSGNTGPSDASNGSDYLYVEASGSLNKQAILNSPCFDLTSLSTPSFNFDYHMYGNNNFGSIALEISADDSDTWVELWSLTGNQGNQWITQTIDLTAYAGGTVKLRFNRIVGGTWQADLALDIFELNEGSSFANTSVAASRSQFATIDINNPINISLYPNPVESGTAIQIQSTVAIRFEVFTVEGKRVYTGSNTERFIETQQLKSGVYFVQFKDEENAITTKRFIVK
ncbi:MAG: chitodextrinase, partial [Dokdonia sp.]